jgi:hypothetical protein
MLEFGRSLLSQIDMGPPRSVRASSIVPKLFPTDRFHAQLTGTQAAPNPAEWPGSGRDEKKHHAEIQSSPGAHYKRQSLK